MKEGLLVFPKEGKTEEYRVDTSLTEGQCLLRLVSRCWFRRGLEAE